MKKKFNLSNKVIIITGALGLLGKKHVEVVAENGGIPIIIDTNKKNVVSLAKNISRKYNVSSMGLKVDITNEKQIINACRKITKT